MVHKLPKAMRRRDDRYTLEGMIEADEGYFTIEASDKDDATQKKGCGSKPKANVMVMAESTVLEEIDTRKVERKCRYFKTMVLPDHKMVGTDRPLQKAMGNEESTPLPTKVRRMSIMPTMTTSI